MLHRKPKIQAIQAIRLIQKVEIERRGKKQKLVRSLATQRIAVVCLTQVCAYIQKHKLGDLLTISKETAEAFLHTIQKTHAQKTIDQYRQVLQFLLTATGQLSPEKHLTFVVAEQKTVLHHRACTEAQYDAIMKAQNARNAFSTRLAYATGLRAHELFTIRPLAEQPADIRHYPDGSVKSLPSKWQGFPESVSYSVVGKGGLCREVRVPVDLALELEKRRLNAPRRIRDREIFYDVWYDIAGGNAWSASFTEASKRALGWSTGAHGTRHAYAQKRMAVLQQMSYSYETALETVSQEMGHFRPSITEVYLR